jgi:hypothetical protein
MFSSKAPADKQTILKGGYPGLLRDEVDLLSGGKPLDIVLNWRTLEDKDKPEST